MENKKRYSYEKVLWKKKSGSLPLNLLHLGAGPFSSVDDVFFGIMALFSIIGTLFSYTGAPSSSIITLFSIIGTPFFCAVTLFPDINALSPSFNTLSPSIDSLLNIDTSSLGLS